MASFSGVSFTVDSESFDEKREARVAVQEIPGGDTFYVDLAGRKPPTWSFRLVLADQTAWGLLNAQNGTESTLIVETRDTHTAVLMSLAGPAPQVDGQQLATASFLITD